MLRRLREISEDGNITIQKLGLATQLTVYKDIIPGYRIRPLTDEEQKAKVTREVKKLRGFEQSLVSNYQAYVETLAKVSRGEILSGMRKKCQTDKHQLPEPTIHPVSLLLGRLR